MGKYKLMKGYPGAGKAYNGWDGWMNPQETNLTRWEPSPTPQPCSAHPCVFDIEGDPQERVDLSKSQPQLLQKLLARYEELAKTEVTRAAAKVCDTGAPDGYLPNKVGGVWQPWVAAPGEE